MTRCQTFKVRPVSPDFRVEADWPKMRRAENVSYYFGQPIPNLSQDPRTLPYQATYIQQRLLTAAPNAGIP